MDNARKRRLRTRLMLMAEVMNTAQKMTRIG
jgi:hypothetical protein